MGGGGGSGGSAGSLAGGGSDSVNISFALGGTGGTGNTGNTVTVDNSGQIVTFGEQSHGIFAQSIGGGGGNGGFAGFDSSAFGSQFIGDQCLPDSEAQCPPSGGGGAGAGSIGSNTFNLAMSVGGFGGTGGHGGNVFVTNTGTIQTTHFESHAIFAQSIGGGGGNGGAGMSATGAAGASESASIAVTVGGFGGAAGDGGDVNVTNNGSLVTWIGGSNGILAQSVGGGGGNGGSATGFTVTRDASEVSDDSTNLEIAVAVGGFGGAAGDGGTVTVTNNELIATQGAVSHGIQAQSIGGGGGNGGGTSLDGEELDAILSSSDATEMKFNVGGFGGASGDGGTVNVINNGTIFTEGDVSYGIFAQSIGGGGGNVGQGGATASGTLAIGGFGGAAGDGGTVNVTNNATIITNGALAYGIFAQSVGGGGGTGGVANMDSARDTRNAIIENNGNLGDTFSPSVSIGIGGFGGASGDGGNVTITNTGSIITNGDGAHGIFAQSIGGGGGNGGNGYISNAGAISFGGAGGSAGNGGDIVITHTGDITTNGFGAYGIFAQSIGGGGGNAGDTTLGVAEVGVDLEINPFGGNSGDGGDITITSTGNITLTGGGALGIFAQSIGGGGGSAGSSTGSGWFGSVGGDGDAGTVTINHSGNVISVGANAIGFFAQSQAAGTPTPFEPILVMDALDGTSSNGEDKLFLPVNVAADITASFDSHIRGGSGSGIGVFYDGGNSNTLTSTGSISAVSGQAITMTTGNDTVENFGFVIGNIDLGTGDNAFNNHIGSEFVTFSMIDLGGGLFTNEGDFRLGLGAPIVPIDLLDPLADWDNFDAFGDQRFNLYFGARVINQVTLNGDFEQTSDGHLAFDIAFGPYEDDHVDITGDVTVAGTGDVTLIWLQDVISQDLFTGDGIATDNGLEITDTIAIDYSIRAVDGDIKLDIETDFGADFLNRNGQALGGHMDANLLIGGASGTGRLLAYLGNLQDEEIYSAVFRELNPEPHLAAVQSMLTSSQSFGDAMLGCDPGQLRDEENCSWARLQQNSVDRDASFENFNLEGDGMSLRGGVERKVSENWRLAYAGGLEAMSYHNIDYGRAISSGNGASFGAALRRGFNGNGNLAFGLSGGWYQWETERNVNVFEPGVAESEPEMNYLEARMRSGWTFENGASFISPRIDFTATQLNHDGFEEAGKAGIGMAGEAHDQTVFAVSPGVEFGWASETANGGFRRLSFDVGGRFFSEDMLELPIGFIQAPPGTSPAMISTEIDDELYSAGVTLEVSRADRFTMEIGYRGEFGASTERSEATIRVGYRF